MPFVTPGRYLLRRLTGTSLVGQIDEGFDALASDVESKLTPHDQGSTLPVSSTAQPSGKAGRTFRVVTTGILYFDTGAGWLALRERVPVVTSLPSGPKDEQEIYYVADAGSSSPYRPAVLWHLMYRASAPAPYRWIYLGGPPLTAQGDGQNPVPGWNANAWANFDGNDPLLGLPLPGVYDARYGGAFSADFGTGFALNLALGVSDPTPSSLSAPGVVLDDLVPGKWGPIAHERKVTVTSTPLQLRQRFYVFGANGSFGTLLRANTFIQATPIAVG